MKDKKEIPIWPLYVADALMFLTVFVLAFHSIILRKSLNGGQMFSLSLLVIAAMLILLWPYILQNKKHAADDDEKIHDKPDPHKEKTEEQFRLIFSELRAIRGKLAQHSDIIEHSEANTANFEKESGAQFVKLQAIDAAVVELKNTLVELSKESEKSEEPVAVHASAQPDEETEKRIKALEVCAHRLKNELEEFKNSFEEIEADEAEEELVSDKSEHEEFEKNTTAEAKTEQPKDGCEFSNESAPQSMEEIACQNSENESCGIPDNSDDGGEAPMSYGDIEIPDKFKAKSWEGLIDKALSNSQTSSTRNVVSRFIEKNKNGESAENEPEIKSSVEESGESENLSEEDFEQDNGSPTNEEYSDENDDDFSEESDTEDDFDEESSEIGDDSDESLSEDELEEGSEEFIEEAEDENLEEEEISTEDFEADFVEEESQEVEEFSQEEIFVEPAQEQTALFAYEEIPQKEKPKKIESGDTAFVANAFPGIGNKLYLRGNGGGLFQNVGTPMQMTEIGKWQWKCADEISDDIKFTIWLNDESPAPIGELTLKPNETLEADVNFIRNA